MFEPAEEDVEIRLAEEEKEDDVNKLEDETVADPVEVCDVAEELNVEEEDEIEPDVDEPTVDDNVREVEVVAVNVVLELLDDVEVNMVVDVEVLVVAIDVVVEGDLLVVEGGLVVVVVDAVVVVVLHPDSDVITTSVEYFVKHNEAHDEVDAHH